MLSKIFSVKAFNVNGKEYDPSWLYFNSKGKLFSNRHLVIEVVYYNKYNKVIVFNFGIPKGFNCDGASTPFGMGASKTKLAAYVHDYLTRTNLKFTEIKGVMDTHRIFIKLLKDTHKFGIIRRNIWKLGVVLFGWMFYKEKTEHVDGVYKNKWEFFEYARRMYGSDEDQKDINSKYPGFPIPTNSDYAMRKDEVNNV